MKKKTRKKASDWNYSFCKGSQYQYLAKVVKVVDADTLDIDLDLGFSITSRQRVRLGRINAWEVRGEEREKGLAAKWWITEKLREFDFEIAVTTGKGKGKYGRYIAEIELPDGTDLNKALVEEGHARWQSY
jgi:micrococcal nuclease